MNIGCASQVPFRDPLERGRRLGTAMGVPGLLVFLAPLCHSGQNRYDRPPASGKQMVHALPSLFRDFSDNHLILLQFAQLLDR
jgi:hypothetical protein